MRTSLVGLQLFLACVLVWGTSVEEEKKECCGPGVPPEKSCCPKENSTSQEPEKKERNLEETEELEERAKEYRERIQHNSGRPYEFTFLKEQAMRYFNKRHRDTFYRHIGDINIKVKTAVGLMIRFPLYLVNTNCTKEQGRQSAVPWYRRQSSKAAPCMALPKHEQKKWKCQFHMFLDIHTRQTTVLRQDCEPVVVWEDPQDVVDMDHLMSFSDDHFF